MITKTTRLEQEYIKNRRIVYRVTTWRFLGLPVYIVKEQAD